MTDDLKEQIRKVQSEYEAAISALDGAVRTMKSFIPENVFAKASIEECERSIESMSRPTPKLSTGTEDESGNGISSAFKQWFEQEWASYRDKSFTDQIAAKAWALKAWRFISANANPTRTQGADAPPFANCRYRQCDLPGQCRDEGSCHHPASGERSADDAQPVAIYQFFVATQGWIDISKESYETAERVNADGNRRIVYATRATPADHISQARDAVSDVEVMQIAAKTFSTGVSAFEAVCFARKLLAASATRGKS